MKEDRERRSRTIPGTSRLQVNGIELDYLEEGAGVPVVFSHGAGSDLRYWEPQREAFASRYRFVAYSRRFHGSGVLHTEDDNSVEAHAADLVEIMRRLDAGPVHLVGFSTTIALRATLREPGLVRSLTIIEPNVPWLLEGDPEGQEVLAWWRAGNERVRAEAAGDATRAAKLWFELVNNGGPGTFDNQTEDLQRMWLENFGAARPAAPPPDPLTCEQLGVISVPTLAIEAEYGTPYSRLVVERLSRCVPNSHLAIIPRATHFMSYQDPRAFNEVVLDFIAHFS
jgi:pimeloyl-ACP methyl ester carboxylesterase